MSIAILVLVGVGLLLMAVSAPLWLEKVPPNPIYGFRTPRLVADPRAWYPANRIMGRDLFLAGAMMALTALASALLAPTSEAAVLAVSLAGSLPPLLAVLHGFYAASALVAEMDGHAPPARSPDAEAREEAREVRRNARRRQADRPPQG